MTKLDDYSDGGKVKMLFRSCEDMNEGGVDWEKLRQAQFYIVRATCDDDVHKAIKYGYWTSTHSTN